MVNAIKVTVARVGVSVESRHGRIASLAQIRPSTAQTIPNDASIQLGVPASRITSASPTGMNAPSPMYAPFPRSTTAAMLAPIDCQPRDLVVTINGIPAPSSQPMIGPLQTVMSGRGLIVKSVRENVRGSRTTRSRSAFVARPARTCPASWVHWSQSQEKARHAPTTTTRFGGICGVTWVLKSYENQVVRTDAAAHSHLARLQASTTCGSGRWRLPRDSLS